MNDPINRASLVQTGLQLLQPIAPGQSPIGQIAQGIGAGLNLRSAYTANEAEKKANEAKLRQEEQSLQIQQKEAENRQKQLEQNAAYQQGMLSNDQRRVKIAEENQKKTLSGMLANSRSAEAANLRFSNFMADAYKNVVLNNEDPSDPNWLPQKLEQFKRIELARQELFGGGTGAPGNEGTAVQSQGDQQLFFGYTEQEINALADEKGVSPDEIRRMIMLKLGQ